MPLPYPSKSHVHIAVTRQVKPGMEAQYEAGLRAFALRSLNEPGTTGVHLLAPAPGTHGSEYGILRSFQDEASCEAFYNSDLFHEWQRESEPLVLGPPIRRKLHGLEAFFRESGNAPPPPRWKMAIVTWLGVFPSALLWSALVPPLLPGVPRLLVLAITNAAVVVTLAWLVMPWLTRLLAPWLRGQKGAAPK